MKDLFANLYNKVFSFFHQSSQNEASKNMACNRLKLVLMQDRTNLSPAIMDRMRKELIDLLSKYLELDRELLELNFEQEDNQMALMLSIPVIRAKDEEEIQEILRKEDEVNNDETESEDETDEEEIIDEKSEITEDEDIKKANIDETETKLDDDETIKTEVMSDSALTEDSDEEEKEDVKTSDAIQVKSKIKKGNDIAK